MNNYETMFVFSVAKGEEATAALEAKFKALIENLSNRQAPAWLTVDKENVTATVNALPKREDIDFPFEEQLIVELYSK